MVVFTDHFYLNQDPHFQYEKNTCRAIICDKIERFLQIQAHFQVVYPDKQQIIRKKNTNKCYDNHQTFSANCEENWDVLAQNSAKDFVFTAMAFHCQQRCRANHFFMNSLSVC